MLVILDQLDDEVVEADVCVIGAGPAGISLAMELADGGTDVVLLEGGGLAPPGPDGLDLYAGEVTGRDYPLQVSRLRYFGGTTGHWGGWSRPLDDVDFAAKAHIEYSGWPIDRATLDPWYKKAHTWLQIPGDDYYLDRKPPFSDSLLPGAYGVTSRFFRFSPPTRFGDEYRESVAGHKEVRCVLDANATGLRLDGTGAVEAVHARSLRGKRLEVRASVTVLAMGGVENARFLLNTHEQPEAAVGNQGDWLGRGFMDHSGWSPGSLVARPGLSYHRFDHDDGPVMPVLGIADEVLLSEKLINCCGTLHGQSFDKKIEKNYFQNAWFDDTDGLGEAESYRFQLIFEPSPCRDSRVTLLDERDAVGLRRTRLNWAFNDSDFEMLSRSIDHFIAYFGLTGLGRLKLRKPVNNKTINSRFGAGMHHMGVTRMSADPATGVVDENCRVHGTDNLFIAGSSVFPSVGFSNPTLSIVALSCRLADHIQGVVHS